MKKLILFVFLFATLFAFGQRRIYQLTNQGTANSGYYVAIDASTFPQTRKMTINVLTSLERAARILQDDTIEYACGLTSAGLYNILTGSNYLKAADFVAIGLTPNLNNADFVLDSIIYIIDTTVANFDTMLDVRTSFASVGFNDSIVTVACTQSNYSHITNAWSNLFTENDTNYISLEEDTLEVMYNGHYRITGIASPVSNNGDIWYLGISVNGTIVGYPMPQYIPTSGEVYEIPYNITTDVIEELSAGDKITLEVKNDANNDDVDVNSASITIVYISE